MDDEGLCQVEVLFSIDLDVKAGQRPAGGGDRYDSGPDGLVVGYGLSPHEVAEGRAVHRMVPMISSPRVAGRRSPGLNLRVERWWDQVPAVTAPGAVRKRENSVSPRCLAPHKWHMAELLIAAERDHDVPVQ